MRGWIVLAAALSLSGGAHAQPMTAEAATKAALERIAALDRAGPRLNAVIALDPGALAQARAIDRRRMTRGPLYGMAVLLKDNIESVGLPTTAGALALKDNDTGRDAPLVARLRAADAVILGKTNLSEWANFRSSRSISGWSAVGGLTRNPYALDRLACGSSSGSAVAVAAGYVPAAIGTETDGSITCPASMNGVVGLKPTVGLVSGAGIVPISPRQDAAGPLARTVTDAARVLSVIAETRRIDYAAQLDAGSLKGARIGVLRATAGRSPQTDAVYASALQALKGAGAVLVEIKTPDESKIEAAETVALQAEFKAALNAYLADAAPAVKTRSLDALIAFNAAEPRETAFFGQDTFEAAAQAPALTDARYLDARGTAHALAVRTLDGMFKAGDVIALVSPTNAPASLADPVNGAKWLGSPSTLPAVAGYPHLTVPMGQVSGLPVGLSFIGPAWSEGTLLSLGYAFEQATLARKDPTFAATVSIRPEISAGFDPQP